MLRAVRCLLFLFGLLNCISLLGNAFVVQLETEEQLKGLTFSPFKVENSGFSSEYIKSLQDILRYDMDNNGMTMIVPDPKGKAIYHLEGKLQEHHLSLRLQDLFQNEEFTIDGVLLTGYLSEDRRIIHHLADRMHQALFGIDGIASSHLLFTIRTLEKEKEISEVWESDYDGGNLRQVTKDAKYCVTPNYIPPKLGYTPGGFFFVGYKTGQPKIYVGSLQEGKVQPLVTLSGNQLMPAISRQRDQVAFICDVTGNPDLFLQAFDPETGTKGKPRHLYTAPYATQGTPAFSPDGKRIAFVSNKSGSPRIYVMEIPPAGTSIKEMKPQLITKYQRENTAPCWSPDGTMIAYCAKNKGGMRQIWVYDFRTGLEKQITQGPGNKENPSWAPNSLHLVYNTSDPNASELYVLNLKQKKPVRISSGPGEKRFPVWEPR